MSLDEPPPNSARARLERARRDLLERATSVAGWRKNRALKKRHALALIDAAHLERELPGAHAPDCERCTDKCCARPAHVNVLRLVDIARLVDAGREDAIETTPITESENHDPAALRALQARDTARLFPRLKRDARGRCVLLDDDDRCTAYDARPLACRRYPLALHTERSAVVLSTGCRSLRVPADNGETEDAVDDVVTHYNEKVRDLIVLAHDDGALERAGLRRYLPIVDER